MKFDRVFFLFLFIVFISSVGIACAVDTNGTQDYGLGDISSGQPISDEVISSPDNHNSYYVDNVQGDDENDGKSWNTSVKTFNKAYKL